MKSLGSVKHQLKQVIFRHVQRQLRDNFKQAPDTCKHNKAISAPGGCKVGICFYGEPPKKILCDAAILDGAEQARDCPWWTALRSKDAVKQEIQKLLLQGDRGLIASRYPDIAALLWVLDTDEDRNALEATIQEASKEGDTSEQPVDNCSSKVLVNGESEGSSPGTPRES